MDRFKIKFRCFAEPTSQSGIRGFKKDQVYEGRSFNGLFEIHPAWGKGGGASKMVDQRTFDKFFKIEPQKVEVH